jgi:hypothetical protein
MPLITSKPVQLPEDVGMYVDALRKKFSAIGDVWLLNPGGDGTETRGRWDLLAFADAKVLDAIRSDPDLQRDDVRMLLAVDGERFESAWGEAESGRLSDIGWRVDDLHNASFVPAGDTGSQPRATAHRVR